MQASTDMLQVKEIAEKLLSRFLLLFIFILFIYDVWKKIQFKGIFRTLQNLYDGDVFSKTVYSFLLLTFFIKKLHRKYSTSKYASELQR